MFFSVPLYFSNDYINFIVNLNSKNTNYKIKRVYNSLDYNNSESSKFEFDRLSLHKAKNFQELYVHSSILKKNDIEFVYAMNSVAPVSNGAFERNIPTMETFLNKLLSVGISTVLVSNQMLADYITAVFPNIKIIISTMMQVDSIKKAQYINSEFHPKAVIPSTDLNKDFIFIESFKKLLPSVELELTANEGCIFCCPLKNLCYSIKGLEENEIAYPKELCKKMVSNELFSSITKNRIIYPWEINVFENLGVNSINIANISQPIEVSMEQIETYMIGSIDSEKIMNKPLSSITSFFKKYIDIPLSTIKENIPSVDFYFKEKPKCKSVCGLDCTNCINLSEKLKSACSVI